MQKLNWRLYKVLDVDYYYTFYSGKFWCIKSEYVVNGTIKDSDFIFQVTTSKMVERTKNNLIQRLSNLFPELPLQQIKTSLQYDKNASIGDL